MKIKTVGESDEIFPIDHLSLYNETLSKFLHNATVIVSVSGGPDSLYALFSLSSYLTTHGGSSPIIVVHYDHRTGMNSSIQQEKMKNLCVIYGFQYVSASFFQKITEVHSETELRTRRKEFVDSCIKSASILNDSLLFVTGHNLTDRIETSIMRLEKSTSLHGFLNMRAVETRKYNDIEYCFFRPLLGIAKREVVSTLKKLSVPYYIDESNADIEYTRRNAIRKNISTTESLFFPFYEKWKSSYFQMDQAYSLMFYHIEKNIEVTTFNVHPCHSLYYDTLVCFDGFVTGYERSVYCKKKYPSISFSAHSLQRFSKAFSSGGKDLIVTKKYSCVCYKKKLYMLRGVLPYESDNRFLLHPYDQERAKKNISLAYEQGRYVQKGDVLSSKKITFLQKKYSVPSFLRELTVVVPDKQGTIFAVLLPYSFGFFHKEI